MHSNFERKTSHLRINQIFFPIHISWCWRDREKLNVHNGCSSPTINTIVTIFQQNKIKKSSLSQNLKKWLRQKLEIKNRKKEKSWKMSQKSSTKDKIRWSPYQESKGHQNSWQKQNFMTKQKWVTSTLIKPHWFSNHHISTFKTLSKHWMRVLN